VGNTSFACAVRSRRGLGRQVRCDRFLFLFLFLSNQHLYIYTGTTELKKGFRYVNFGNVAFPAELGRLAPKEKTKFVPTTWFFNQAGRGNVTALPVELSYSPSPVQDQLTQADLNLLDDLQKVLVEKNLSNILGVELVYPSVPGIKFKRGPNVITLPAEFRDVVPGTESYPTLWVFHPKNGVTVQCVEIGGPIGEFFFDDEF
jgi:hypothetical protein